MKLESKINALHVYVSRLRSALDPERGRGERSLLETRSGGYQLNIDPDRFDVVQFEREVAQGQLLLKTDPGAATEKLASALSLWKGPAFDDFAYDDFAQVERSRLSEARVAALEDRIEADLALGLSGELVSELEVLRDEHPLRERLVSHQALALYRSGRPADALRAIDRFRRHVGDELGIDPSPSLLRLEEQVLLHDRSIHPRTARLDEELLPKRELANPFKGLRPFGTADAANFFGRDALVAELLRTLGSGQRLVALVRASGSGKSSVIRAGLIPALAKNAIEGSDQWLVATMMPGAHPFAELEGALLRTVIDGPDSLDDQLQDEDAGLVRAALRILPDDDSRLVLVIDQFEELFTMVDDEAVRERFQGALERRAGDLFEQLEPEEQEAARQLFLRLVSVTEQDRRSRRRVAAREIASLAVDSVIMHEVIGSFGAHRLLSFDSDPLTGAPTVEVAHEALLTAWPKLEEWIDETRGDLRRHGALAMALREWQLADRNPQYLLASARLAEHDEWSRSSLMSLNIAERDFLDAGLARLEEERAVEERDHRDQARSRRRLWTGLAFNLALADDGFDYSTQGDGLTEEMITPLDQAITDVSQGRIDVPTIPTGPILTLEDHAASVEDAPLGVDGFAQFSPIDPGTYDVNALGTPVSVTLEGDWWVQPNIAGETVFSHPDFQRKGDRDVVFFRPTLLSDPMQPQAAVEAQEWWPLEDIEGWLENLVDGIATTGRQPRNRRGRAPSGCRRVVVDNRHGPSVEIEKGSRR